MKSNISSTEDYRYLQVSDMHKYCLSALTKLSLSSRYSHGTSILQAHGLRAFQYQWRKVSHSIGFALSTCLLIQSTPNNLWLFFDLVLHSYLPAESQGILIGVIVTCLVSIFVALVISLMIYLTYRYCAHRQQVQCTEASQ